MHGNRDFLVAERFARATGIQLIADPTAIDLYGTPALLMHGDTLGADDHASQAFRAQVRDPAWQRAALSKPVEERLAIARGLRVQSEGAKEGKAEEIMDVAAAAVEEAFTRSAARLLIHGHTHRPARHVSVVAGQERVRWVLADWYEAGSYLEVSEAGIRSVSLD